MVDSRACLFITLNAVRILSVISLILLISGSILSMVQDVKAVNAFLAAGKVEPSVVGNSTLAVAVDDDYIENSTVPNQPAGAFWAVLNWLLIIFQCIVLIISEVSFKYSDRFFIAFFPVLGPNFGLGALGVIQCLLGAAVLSHHVNEFTLVAAFLLFSIGCLNIFLGLLYREKAKWYRDVTEWRESKKDVLPTVDRSFSVTGGPPEFVQKLRRQNSEKDAYRSYSGAGQKGVFRSDTFLGRQKSFRSNSPEDQNTLGSGGLTRQKSGMGWGRRAELHAQMMGYGVTEPEQAVPPYAPKPNPRSVNAQPRAHFDIRDSTASEYSSSRNGKHEYQRDNDDEGSEHEDGHEHDHYKDKEGAHEMSRTNSDATAVEE